MLYTVIDHAYISLDYLGVTKKQPQEIDPRFDKITQINFHGTGISDIILYILSSVTMFNNIRGSTCLT